MIGAPLAVLSDTADESLPETIDGLQQSAVTFEAI